MSFHVRTKNLSPIHVAKSRDLYLQGGYLERTDSQLRSWPWLHMHISFGNINGAVWANQDRDAFLLVALDSDGENLVRVSELSQVELAAFTKKKGVFWTLEGKR